MAQLLLQQGKVTGALDYFERAANLARTEAEIVNALSYAEATRTQLQVSDGLSHSGTMANFPRFKTNTPNWRISCKVWQDLELGKGLNLGFHLIAPTSCICNRGVLDWFMGRMFSRKYDLFYCFGKPFQLALVDYTIWILSSVALFLHWLPLLRFLFGWAYFHGISPVWGPQLYIRLCKINNYIPAAITRRSFIDRHRLQNRAPLSGRFRGGSQIITTAEMTTRASEENAQLQYRAR